METEPKYGLAKYYQWKKLGRERCECLLHPVLDLPMGWLVRETANWFEIGKSKVGTRPLRNPKSASTVMIVVLKGH